MKKVVFGITSLTLGGAERVLVDIANKLSNNFDITIFTIYAKGELENQLNKNINLISIYNKPREQYKKWEKMCISLKLLFFKKQIYKKYFINKYDIEVAFLEGAITRLFSVKNEKTHKIAWVHNDISKVFGNNFKAKLKKKIDEKIYKKYEKIILVSKENLENFIETYPKINKKVLKVIYNYINPENIIQKAGSEKQTNKEDIFNIVTVARLVEQKAIDRLIKVHNKLIKKNIEHEIYVIGDGPEKERLQNLIYQYGVEKTFKLLGKKENPYPYMKKSDVIALLSYYEGYGMVIEEAKILGKYIIVTNTAAREAVSEYKNSKIVENNEEAIYNGLKELILEGKKQDIQSDYDNEKYIKQIIDIMS